ncbi:penicillin acylase family protein [Pseudofulvimonas gallinarii]|nr:penicillin acylase family protein [Pseudofulvimonas gallinarii]THD12903.1 hypothetical protein B1808_11445 [Pseudofulvimonas gallinarii]
MVVMLAGLVILSAWILVRGSLPALDGEHPLPGLAATVSIERDSQGIATLRAGSRADLSRALGFVHAQERFLDMDLARRVAAGELAALVGGAALPLDRRHRLHRFRDRATRWLQALPTQERAALDAYGDGVNAGLAALSVRPWPYLLLRQQPQPWRSEDSLLVVLAMFFDLQEGDNRRERQLERARRHLSTEVFDFIVRGGTEWDAPVTGEAMADPPLPGPGLIDLRRHPSVQPDDIAASLDAATPMLPGSNNFAVAGTLTGDGRALVADDMHLGLRAPNIWYRLGFEYTEGGRRVRADGLSLPGVPALVVGSNGHVAWSFTNSYGDWQDLVRLDTTDDGLSYHTAHGSERFIEFEESLEVAGGDPETLRVRETLWGPVIGEDSDGSALALVWTAHRDGAVNATLSELERATDVDAAVDVARRAGIPAQNMVVADASGRIAWTLAGRIPLRRAGHDPARPVDGRTLDGDLWLGWVTPEDAPGVIDPPSGRLWTANARVVDGDALAVIGDGGYDNGARAAQIRDGLFARERFSEADLLAIQLDDRALFLERWWRLLRRVIEAAPDDSALSGLSAATAIWDGCACTDSSAYRLVRAFRGRVHDIVMRGLAAPVRAHDGDFTWPRLGQNEGVVWQLLRERPAHLLPPPHADWNALLRAAAREVAEALEDQPGGLAARTWGEANTVRIRHPLSGALPGWLARHLDRPAQALPGDAFMPRVQGVAFGASQRSVIAPGAESRALAHAPAGQSGHPLSPYYDAGHDDWAEGRASPLLPGPPHWTLELVPAR